ncbi:Hypothetical predicted protein [Pelobates cultripes]|uniref:Uncharacterized protein n=1 Tax=Pelobates cultripes TaxID=61616 RepID=A0AAD1WIS7_PELCU|nr:Hypothetical predicted protein [Pelobates cultripes]
MPDTTAPVIWEAYKYTIQGFFLARGAMLKKHREATIRDLTDRIQDLETRHKPDHDLDTYQELAEVRGQLSSLLRQRHQCSLQHTKAFFYINSDKCGKLLTALINKKPTRHSGLTTEDANLHHRSSKKLLQNPVLKELIRRLTPDHQLHTNLSGQ